MGVSSPSRHSYDGVPTLNQELTARPAGKIIPTKEASGILRKHPKTLDRWRKEGRGPRWSQPEGPGTTVCYLEHEVIEFALGGSQ